VDVYGVLRRTRQALFLCIRTCACGKVEQAEPSLAQEPLKEAALYGLMKKIRDLDLPLVSVIQLEKGEHVYLPSHDPASAEAGRA